MRVKSKNKKETKEKNELIKGIIIVILFSALLFFLIEFVKWLPMVLLVPLERTANLKECVTEEGVCFFALFALFTIITILTGLAFIIIPGAILGRLLIKEKIRKKKITKIESYLKIAAHIALIAQVLIEKISSF